MARLYHSNPQTNLGKKIEKILDFKNPFHNNLAQAIEILEYHKKSEKLLEKLMNIELDPTISNTINQKESYQGLGAIEAPRGGLYHEFHFGKDGVITYANIITPTVQNLTSIEKSANSLIGQHKFKSEKEANHLLEMLVRAYDPCITCSVH